MSALPLHFEPSLDRLAGFATRLLHAPIAVVFASGGRIGASASDPVQYARLQQGGDRLLALCDVITRSTSIMVVEDGRTASPDCTNAALAYIPEFGVAMLAMPLSIAGSELPGCLLVIDDVPRRWSSHDVGSLAEMSHAVRHELERHAALVTSEHALQQSERTGEQRVETAVESARERETSLLVATLEATGDGILVVDLEGRITRCNRRFLELWRIDGEGLVGAPLGPWLERAREQLVDANGICEHLASLAEHPGATASDLIRFHDGRVFEWTSHPQVLDAAVLGRVWGFRDVTARAELEARLAHQAYHDALTGLANRTQFRSRIARAFDLSAATGRSADHIAILLLDLDGFKLVNDSAGHAAGDALLVQVTSRLLNATRGSDLIARIGGDEFGILLERVRCGSDAIVVAERIRNALRDPFRVGGTLMNVGTSIGIARGDDEMLAADRTMQPVDAVLRNADLALYEAKRQGRGVHATFEPTMHEAAVQRVSLEGELRRAMQRGELTLAYQPIVSLADGGVVGVESLLRWTHATRGDVSPCEFIPIAEETGLIVPLGKWVMEEACRQCAAWARRPGAPKRTVSVNVSGRQLQQHTFVEDVEHALLVSGLPPECLTLELTESTVIQYSELAREKLTAVKALGVGLAIDDFGTGYSALSHLQHFPFDTLKIDKSFVARAAEGGQGEALARAIVGLAHALALRTVAEGVETPEQSRALVAMGCDFGQGYLFARPLTALQAGAVMGAAVLP